MVALEPTLGLSWALLIVASVVSVAIFLAAWERTRAVGIVILGFFAVVVILGAVVGFYGSAYRHVGHFHGNRESSRVRGTFAHRASQSHRAVANGDVVQRNTTADAPTAVDGDPATSPDAEDDGAGGRNKNDATGERAPRAGDGDDRAVTPPEWVNHPPGRSGAVFRRVIRSDPFSTDDECYRQVEDKMLVTTCQYVSDRVGNAWSRELRRHESLPEIPPDLARQYLDRLDVDPAYLWEHVCPEPEYREWVDSSVDTLADPVMGPMRRIHVLMEIDEAVQRELVGRWREWLLLRRLGIVGSAAAAVLGLVAVVFTYLKIDTATRGYYSRRLQLVAAVVTIAIMLAILRMIAA